MDKAALTETELATKEFETERDIVASEIDSLNMIAKELDKDIQVDIKTLTQDRDQRNKNFKEIIEKINIQRSQTKKTKGVMVEALRSWRTADEEQKRSTKQVIKIEALINIYEKQLNHKTSLIDAANAEEIQRKKNTAEQKDASNATEAERELKALEEIEGMLESTIKERDEIIDHVTKTLKEILELEEKRVKKEAEDEERNRVLNLYFDLLKKINRNSKGSIYKSLPKLQENQNLFKLEAELIQKNISKIDPSLEKEEAYSEDISNDTRDEIEALWTKKWENYDRLIKKDDQVNSLIEKREEVEKAYKKAFGKKIDSEVDIYEAEQQLMFLSLTSDTEKAGELDVLYREKEKHSQSRNKAFDQTMVHHHIVVKNLNVKKKEEESITHLCSKYEKELEKAIEVQRALLSGQAKAEKSKLLRESISRALNPLELKLEFLNKTLSSTAR